MSARLRRTARGFLPDALLGATLALTAFHIQLILTVIRNFDALGPDGTLVRALAFLDLLHALIGALLVLVLGAILRLLWPRRRAGPSRLGTRARQLALGTTAATTLALTIMMLVADDGLLRRMSPSEFRARAEDAPNVLLIVADSLRRDAFDDAGEINALAPAMSELARQSTDFTECQAASCWTPPSMASLLSGRYPGVLNAHDGTLPQGVTTLAEYLRGAGYETVAISDNYLTHPRFGFGQGHEYYWQRNHCVIVSELWFGHWRMARFYEWFVWRFELQYKGAPRVNARFAEWSTQRDPDRPFYAMLHYMDTHYPYYVYDEAGNVSRDSQPGNFVPYFEAQLRARGRPRPPWADMDPPREEVEDFKLRYKGSVQYLDRHVAAVLDWLKSTGEWDKTLIVFTADHGEEFYEHNYLGHGRALYQESTRVPLLVKWPAGESLAASVVDAPVSGLQLMPTVLRIAGLVPGDPDLLAELPAAPTQFWEPVFSEFSRSGVRSYSGRFDRVKLIYTTTSAGRELFELYDLVEDPSEQQNQAAMGVQLPEAFANALAAFVVEANLDGAASEPSQERSRVLKSLGYTR